MSSTPYPCIIVTIQSCKLASLQPVFGLEISFYSMLLFTLTCQHPGLECGIDGRGCGLFKGVKLAHCDVGFCQAHPSWVKWFVHVFVLLRLRFAFCERPVRTSFLVPDNR